MSAARRDGSVPNGGCAICGQRAVVTFHTIRPGFVISACGHCLAKAEANLQRRAS